ncbi:MAG: amino acid permease [Candidatus Dormibacteraeota bacterium]|uniref:Amino acid permease n=2 Tax=Candidatus Aeolococcus gillhamiae TaxID=3127015 RepID=A0A934K1C4_9BACT|nr:amino acid permease [Candidatus Dormibacteraeota bacterium]MBJ7605201.1 amino acid permease [Candidatus Dormibacteraeota bacterium]
MVAVPPSVPPSLTRRLGVLDAVVIGLGSMIGAGVFAAFAPAAAAAGSGLLIGLAIAAVVAYCNATSSARLAALYPQSGGAYVYGRARLGDFWGYLAGWGFVVGKTASCAAMALTFASYVAPNQIRLVGVLAVLVLTAVNYRGIQKAAWLTRLIVVLTLLTLAVVVIAALAGGHADVGHVTPFPGAGVRGLLQAAGLLFFAFAGYARIATLGEEVRDPARTIPRAIPIALGIALAVYALVALCALLAAGPAGLAASTAPLRAVVEEGTLHRLAPAVQIGAAIAALGSLLALILGASRTAFAMARDHHLPGLLATVHPRHGAPHRAELVVGAVAAILVASIDLRGAIGFSSFTVLTYYAITNASALTLTPDENRPPRWLPLLGLTGCITLAFSLPLASILSGASVLLLGALLWTGHRRATVRRTT